MISFILTRGGGLRVVKLLFEVASDEWESVDDGSEETRGLWNGVWGDEIHFNL
jgi:hypothetical protein